MAFFCHSLGVCGVDCGLAVPDGSHFGDRKVEGQQKNLASWRLDVGPKGVGHAISKNQNIQLLIKKRLLSGFCVVFACGSGNLLYLCSRAFRERVRKAVLTNLLLTI